MIFVICLGNWLHEIKILDDRREKSFNTDDTLKGYLSKMFMNDKLTVQEYL